jgi:hypothetical protein
MSSPPPPWESHPPLSEDGFYEADPDVDTGPVHVVTPTDEDIAGEDARKPLLPGVRLMPLSAAAAPAPTSAIAPAPLHQREPNVNRWQTF